jgi:DNA polymerase I
MKVTFWLLDINYEAKDESSEIWLWGITNDGKRVLIVDRNFVPYFYAAVVDDADPAKVVEEITTSHCVLAAKPEIVERRLFGKPVKAVKIHCKNAEGMTKCAKQLREFEGVKDCFEDDIRVAMRYLIDNDVVPCGWHEIEATEEANKPGVRIDKVYLAKSFPKPIGKIEAPPLRVLGFSVICYSREGSPKPDRNPIIIISVATNRGEQKQFLADENRNDKSVLEAFVNYVESFDPDIIVGYGVNGQDWQYLTSRCKKLGLHLRVDRAKTEPHGSVYGHVSLNGRINLDLTDYADEFPEVKVKTLANLADYLGIMKIENRILVEDIDFADYWDAQAKRGSLKRFSMDNTCCIMGITETILDFAM